ncbi:MAG TPA: TolC family protein [Bryobacteraceae bacterium]|jgi:outer membrane protein TolC|nr:TolC family protein [Bryobacteraceae bacterium]
MDYFRRVFAVLCIGLTCFAQTPEVSIQEPKQPPIIGPLLRPFHIQRRIIAPAVLSNTPRLESLVRSGNLYLSVQDVIAVTLENNLDIAIQRYAPYLAREVTRRAQSGQPLRSVGLTSSPGPQSVSLTGVTSGAVGLPDTGSGVGSGGGYIISSGTTPPNLDPGLFFQGQFAHQTTPLSNLLLAGVPFLLQDTRYYAAGYSQSFTPGTNVQFTFQSFRTAINSPDYAINPYTSGSLDLFIQQPLLQGFGIPVNNRFIRVAKNNQKVSDLELKRQTTTTISAVLNLYWDLVSFNESVRIREQALATAQQLLEGNQHQAELGTLPKLEVTRAQAEVSSSKENLLIAQTNVAQQEIVLKNALSRNGVASPWLDEVHVVPLDKIVVPEKEDLKPTAELIAQALDQRPELEQARINIESNKINAAGTKSLLLPVLNAFVDINNQGLTGPANPIYNNCCGAAAPAVVGGYGNLLGQLALHHFPNYAAGFSLNIQIRNRQAQADYVIDQLAVRQGELQLQKFMNQVRADVKNAVIGLQQARARYETAVGTRKLSEETLGAETNRFKFGESTIPAVVQAQRDLATSQDAEIQATANYTHAKIAFDEAVGQTLNGNGISMQEVIAGRVERESSIPAKVPQEVKQ